MDGVHIGPWSEADSVALDKTLDETDPLTSQFRPQQGPPTADPFRISIVARGDSGPIGIATAYESRWHPKRLWVSVEVASPCRRQGVGSALLDAVRAASDDRPFRGKVFAGGAAAGFAAAHGFRVIQRSRTVRLERPLSSTPQMAVEFNAAPELVASALFDLYLRTHAWDPPGNITVDDVLAVHVADAACSLMVRDATSVVLAAACLYDEEDGLELSGGATGAAGALARPAVGALLDSATTHAATQARPLLDEVHIIVDDRAPADPLADVPSVTATLEI